MSRRETIQVSKPIHKADEGAAAYDLSINDALILRPGSTYKIGTGLKLNMTNCPGIHAFVFMRSGIASKHDLSLVNGVGVIDNSYQGEIKLALHNYGKETITLPKDTRVAQLVFLDVISPQIEVVDEVQETTERGSKGFGSSGTAATDLETKAPIEAPTQSNTGVEELEMTTTRVSEVDKKIINGKADLNQLVPFKYNWAWTHYKNTLKNFWIPDEIAMSEDVAVWKSDQLEDIS